MNNKLIWIVGVIAILIIGYAVIKNQQPAQPAMEDSMMKAEESVHPTDAMMESSGTEGMMKEDASPSSNTMMEGNGDRMMEPTGPTGKMSK